MRDKSGPRGAVDAENRVRHVEHIPELTEHSGYETAVEGAREATGLAGTRRSVEISAGITGALVAPHASRPS